MKNNDLLQTLSAFKTISLAEMDRVKLMNRMETKFVFKRTDFAGLLKQLATDYFVVQIGSQLIHSYESLYFDDKDFHLYNEHHRGRLNRFKVRYRKYVESNIFFFEIKHKRKGRTSKQRVKVRKFNETPGQLEKSLLNQSEIPKLNLVPAIANSYKRITLVNKTSVERLTFDIDLAFNKNGQNQKLESIVIAELKQERIVRTSPFFALAKKMKLRPFRLSKYCTGLIQTDYLKQLKHNRFKKKLIQLNKILNYGTNVV